MLTIELCLVLVSGDFRLEKFVILPLSKWSHSDQVATICIVQVDPRNWLGLVMEMTSGFILMSKPSPC
jgi:hypothetical protein